MLLCIMGCLSSSFLTFIISFCFQKAPMAPRKRVASTASTPTHAKGPSSTPTTVPDSIFGTKNVLPDKGFHDDCLTPPHGLDFLSPFITTLSWNQFCQPREQPALPLVREFYDNLRAHQSSVVYVCGSAIPFLARIINELFALPEPAIDGYEAML